jgi:oxygen-independent coproporphyrinogen-3 oxidase
VARSFGIAGDAEITAEANPETIDRPYLRALLAAGFNRLSIGIQSLAPGVLERLGRTHSASTALCALRDARDAGFTDLNADLIYGSPWESERDWETSLAGVIDAGPDHVSAYSLIVEEGTPLHTLVATGRVPDVDPDVQADRHATAEAALGGAGYHRYEVSNWSKPGRASRHNVLYWSTGDYIGFGAGAHSHVAGRRWWAKKLPRDYIAACSEGASTAAGDEILVGDQRAGEALMLGLRLSSGIDTERFEERFGGNSLASREAVMGSLEAAGLVERVNGKLRLTSGGTMLANEALCRLL